MNTERSSLRSCALLWAVLAVGTPTLAQEDPTVVQARQRWQEGVTAFEEANYELARAAFAQAYALKPIPAVLRNWGEAEVAGGHYMQGANHLAQFLREADEVSPEDHALVERSIAKAAPYLGRLALTTDVIGAQVLVDNKVVGITPIDRVYLEPGLREVRLAKDGREVHQLVESIAGERVALYLRFRPSEEAGQTSNSLAPPAAPRDSHSSWKVPVVVTGGVLALAGLGTGGYFLFRGNSLASEADSLRSELGSTGSQGTCLNPAEPRCAELQQTVADGRQAERLAIGGLVAGGALAVGTALAWWLWPTGSEIGSSSLRAAPLYDPSGTATFWGGALSGTF